MRNDSSSPHLQKSGVQQDSQVLLLRLCQLLQLQDMFALLAAMSILKAATAVAALCCPAAAVAAAACSAAAVCHCLFQTTLVDAISRSQPSPPAEQVWQQHVECAAVVITGWLHRVRIVVGCTDKSKIASQKPVAFIVKLFALGVTEQWVRPQHVVP